MKKVKLKLNIPFKLVMIIMKRVLILTIITLLILSTSLVEAKPNLVPATVDKAKQPVTVVIPAHAVEIADGVFSLGTVEINGKMVEGFLFIDYREGFEKPPWVGSGKGKGESKCYAFLANGVKWKTTEPYVLDINNEDGLTQEFVITTAETSFNTWDSLVAFDIFGARDTTSTVDGADTSSPDDKNEVFFGNIEESGAIAVTIVWGIFRGPPSGRELIEYDIIFDDADYRWGDAGPTSETTLGDTSVMDFQNIATHEIGHAVGMGHPDDSCTEETMYRFAESGETKKRTLNNGDMAGTLELYS